jgi:hypothetical protein
MACVADRAPAPAAACGVVRALRVTTGLSRRGCDRPARVRSVAFPRSIGPQGAQAL